MLTRSCVVTGPTPIFKVTSFDVATEIILEGLKSVCVLLEGGPVDLMGDAD